MDHKQLFAFNFSRTRNGWQVFTKSPDDKDYQPAELGGKHIFPWKSWLENSAAAAGLKMIRVASDAKGKYRFCRINPE